MEILNYDEIIFNTVTLSDKKFRSIDNNTKSLFINFINKLESNSSVYLCTRGDSYKNKEIVSGKTLNNIFAVGEKSRLHNRENSDFVNLSKYNKFCSKEKNQDLISDIKKLIQELNDYIEHKPYKEKPLKGGFNKEMIIEMTNPNSSNKQLKNNKYFLLAFLHNSYKNDDFNSNTPFISLAHGENKYEIARKFALGYDKVKDNYTRKEGYIYLYCLPMSNTAHEYIVTSKLGDAISQMGIKNYEDKYSEIILTNGMYPHFLFGIFKITDSIIKRFTINPALVRLLEEDKEFDYRYGLDIDQDNFKNQATELGYNTYFQIINGVLKIINLSDNIKHNIDTKINNHLENL